MVTYTARRGLTEAGKAHLNTRQVWVNWNVTTCFIGFILMSVMLILSYPAVQVFEMGFSKKSLTWLWGYLTTFVTHYDYWWDQEVSWIVNANKGTGLLLPISVWVSILLPAIFTFIGTSANPHWALPTHLGRARKADYRVIKRMGLLNGWLVVLGRWKGKYLMLKETLTVLCMAPPGTGKTTGIVVPTILTCDRLTMIVNDVKPEIAKMTSGYRETVSMSFLLEWAASDKPDDKIFYPRWNCLSPGTLPPKGANRDLYMDRLTNIIVEEPQGNQDPHWTIKGRASLVGMMHYVAAKVEAGNLEGIPKKWHGKEPSIPMIIDWLNEGIYAASKVIDELRKTDPNAAMMADPMREFLSDAADEAIKNDYSSRAFLELNQLANTPDKERGSILSTMDGGLIVFKNSAVVARTSASDFEFMDVRGMTDESDGKLKPITIYLAVNLEDARAMGTITGLFIESLTAWLVSHPPNGKTRDGEKVGPYPVLFVLDEFPQMPKLDALMKGPEVGRGQKVSYLLIGQDLSQVEETYGKTGVERFFSNSYAKVILPVANDEVATRFANMMGKTTIIEKSKSRDVGLGTGVNPFKANVSTSYKDHDIWGKGDLLNMEFGEQLVLIQGYTRRFIECDTPFYFKDAKYRRMVSPEEGGDFPTAPPMPDYLMERRAIEFAEESKQEEEIKQEDEEIAAAEIDESIYSRIVVMFSDIVAISEDKDIAILEIACCELQDGKVTGSNFHIFSKLALSDLQEYKENIRERVPNWIDSYDVSIEKLDTNVSGKQRREILAAKEAEEIAKNVPYFSEVAEELIEWTHPSPIVAYNAGLEFGVVNPELMKAEKNPIPGERIFSVLDWASENLPSGNFTVEGMAKHFSVDSFEKEHGLKYLQFLAGVYLKIEEIEINHVGPANKTAA